MYLFENFPASHIDQNHQYSLITCANFLGTASSNYVSKFEIMYKIYKS